MSKRNSELTLSDSEWQIVLDALSNTIFNEDLTEEARKSAKELYLKLQKKILKRKVYSFQPIKCSICYMFVKIFVIKPALGQ